MTVDEWLVVLGFAFCALGYALAFACGPLRNAFVDGFRCLRCHPRIYWAPGILGSAYAAFVLAREVQRRLLLAEESVPATPELAWTWAMPNWHALAFEAWKTMLERVAGTFHVAVTAGPLGAVGALLFLLNWKSTNAVIRRGLSRRFPRAGWLVYGIMLLCAVAAMIRLAMFFAVEFFASKEDARPWLFWAGVVDAFGWTFEYLVGAFIQVALLVMALAWVRGVDVAKGNLVLLAARRFCFALPWLLLVLLLGAVATLGPVLATGYHPALLGKVLPLLPWAVAGLNIFMLLFPTMQINMVMEIKSLRGAFAQNARFFRAHAGHYCWFVLLSGALFFALAVGDRGLRLGLGEWTIAGVAWTLIAPWLWALPVGWVLASWVCFNRACELNQPDRSVAY